MFKSECDLIRVAMNKVLGAQMFTSALSILSRSHGENPLNALALTGLVRAEPIAEFCMKPRFRRTEKHKMA